MAQAFDFMTHTSTLWEEGGAKAEVAAGALCTLCKNILQKPSNLKYRRVPTSGAAFSSRVASCPGALAVLSVCGFTTLTYPDGDYFVMKNVDAALLHDVVCELEMGLETMARVRAKRAAEAADSEPPLVDDADLFEDVGGGAAAGSSASSSAAAAGDTISRLQPPRPTEQPGGTSSEDTRRQLAARSVVHRVAAREQARQKRVRERSVGTTLCAAFVVLVGISMAFTSAMAVVEDYS